MALRNLSAEEMGALSQAWVGSENPARQALEQLPRLAPLLPDVERAHAALSLVRRREQDPRRAALSLETARLDALHDRLARGIYGVLTELSLLDEDASLLLVRDALLPQGIAKAIQASYRGQSGYAGLLRARLTPDLCARLESVCWSSGTLLHKVEAWLETAERLGVLEEERGRLAATQGPSTQRQTLQARNGWVRVVSAMRSMAALSALEVDIERLLWGPLREAEVRADARALKRKASNAEAPEVTATRKAEERV